MLPISQTRVLRFYAKELNAQGQGVEAKAAEFSDDAEFEVAFKRRFWRSPDHSKADKVIKQCINRGWIGFGFNVFENNKHPIVLKVAGVEHWREIERSMTTKVADWLEKRNRLTVIFLSLAALIVTIIKFWPLD